MKILFYDTKKYDKESFDKVLPKYEDIEIEYVDSDISVRNAVYAKGFEAVCGFVSSDFSAKVIDVLADNGVKIILLRCAGFNNVDVKRAKERGVLVLRVPGYSPEAVAEHAMALALQVTDTFIRDTSRLEKTTLALWVLQDLISLRKQQE